MRTVALFAVCVAIAACTPPKVSQDEMDSVNYGPKPQLWKEEITSYLRLRLKDPTNAVIDFRTEPKQMFQKQVGLDPQVHGWAVCVWIRDKNRAGQWTDAFPMVAFIRNEKVVHVNNPPDNFGPAGPLYARRQCQELGAPFKDK
jgi:hypothetical protein